MERKEEMMIFKTSVIKRYYFFVFLFFLTLFANNKAFADDHVLKVGISDLPPLMFMDKEQKPDGYFVDIVDSMMHRLNKKYEYVFYSKKNLKEYAQKGLIDLYITKSTSPIVDSNFVRGFVILHTNMAVFKSRFTSFKKLADLKGKKIVMCENSYFVDLCKSLKMKPRKFLFEGDIKKRFARFEKEKCDLLLGEHHVLDYFAKQPDYLGKYTVEKLNSITFSFSFALRQNQDKVSMADFNQALFVLSQQKVLDKIEGKWFVNHEVKELVDNLQNQLIITTLVLLSLFFVILLLLIQQRTATKNKQKIAKYLASILDALPFSVVFYSNSKTKKHLYRNFYNRKLLKEFSEKALTNEEMKHIYSAMIMPNRGDLEKLVCGENIVKLMFHDNTEYYKNERLLIRRGEDKYLLSVSNNITELVEARRKADEAKLLKSSFLANMSHDLRTPLNAIVGFTGLIMETVDREDLMDYSKIIQTNTDYLLNLINDVVHLSKLQIMNFKFNYKQEDINLLLSQLQSMFKQQLIERAKERKIELMVSYFYESCYAYIDRNNLLRVLSNILSNACKYTEEGRIELGAIYKNERLIIYVKDSGVGLSKEDLKLLFEPFTRFNDLTQGTGLGMTISKAIMTKMGGAIHVKSDAGKGSLFWIVQKTTGYHGRLNENVDKKVINKLFSELNK